MQAASLVTQVRSVNNVIFQQSCVTPGDRNCLIFMRDSCVHDNGKLGRNEGKIETKDQYTN
jgi:hypothetical protein